MPPIPNTPQPLAELQARYPKALEHVYDVAAVCEGAIRPGEVAANVFDFEDGLKLIISRERFDDGKVRLHVSASFPAKCRLADEFRLLSLTMSRQGILGMFIPSIPRRFAELSGDKRPLTYIGLSNGWIPHYCIEEEP